MTDLAVSERRIRPIQDAAATGNWKQALQLCEKWQKKGEKSDRFLALKASVLVNQPDKVQINKGKAETLELCRRANPVTNIEALYQLQENLKRLSLGNEESLKLWDRAILAVPNDKNLLVTFLRSSIADSNWLMAQKAAMALRKAFPKDRQYDFWNILLCYLIHEDRSLSQKDRTLFGTLAYRLISKAAESVPIDPTQVLSPGKAIATPDELALLSSIYLSTSRTEELVKILQGDTVGLHSKLANQDSAMVFSLLVSALRCSSSFGEVFRICENLLTTQQTGEKNYVEDDRIWRLVVDSSFSMGGNQPESCSKLIDDTLLAHPSCRAAHLAKLDLLTRSNLDNKIDDKRTMDACRAYYGEFAQKPFCFDDLVAVLHSLNSADLQIFVAEVLSDDLTDVQKLFQLKLDYSLLSDTESTENDFLDLTAKALRLHKDLSEEKMERPEAALIAALSLLRLAVKTQDTHFSVQASFLLDAAYSKSNEYYPLALRLVQIHRTLGSLSLATEHFISLSVKNMQWETVGHLLLTRISTLSPFQSGHGEESLDPLNAFDAGLDMLEHMEGSLDKAIEKGLEFGSYSNVVDTVNLKHNVQHSLNRQVFLVEERKINSLVGVPVETALADRPLQLIDKRDVSFLNDYGSKSGSLEAYLTCGPLPGEGWLDAMRIIDHLHTYLRAEVASQSLLATDALKALQISSQHLTGASNLLPEQLTVSEIECFECIKVLINIVPILRDGNIKPDAIDASVDKILAFVADCRPKEPITVHGIKIPTWEFLHSCFTQLEVLQLLALFASLLLRKAKSNKGKSALPTKDTIGKIQKAVSDAEKRIHDRAREIKMGINEAGVLGKLVDVAAGRLEDRVDAYQKLGEQYSGLFDEITVEQYCGRLRESWDDAVDGVLISKLRYPK